MPEYVKAVEAAFNLLLVAFLITQLSELAVGFLFGFRRVHYFLVIFVVNLITNPALNYILLILYETGITISFLTLIIIELAVVLSETSLLIFALPKSNRLKILIFSPIANAVSFAAGLMLL